MTKSHRRPSRTSDLAKRREQLLRERGPLPRSERDGWHRIDGPGEDWVTSVRFVIREGRPVIAQLRVTPYQSHQWSEPMDIPPQGLTTSDLRRIHIRWDDDLHRLVAELFSDLGATVGRSTAPKHVHKDDDFYAEKAVEYLEALHRSPRRPLAWLEEQYRTPRRKQWVTREQIRDWVHGARVRGFLTAGSRGRAGAEPTEKLERWAKTRKVKLPTGRKRQGGRR